MKHKQNVKEKLAELVAIESVSADPKRFGEVINAAAYIKQWLVELGCKVEVEQEKDAAPLIVATYTVPSATATIGVYAHYDVQAEDPVKEWHSAPFTVVEKDDMLWGRGVADDKGHIVQSIQALEEAIQEKTINNTIVFIFEGEEEIGGVHLETYLKKAASTLQACDFLIIADSGMRDKKTPMFEYGLRGLVYYELTITTGKRDMHSGVYGNAVANPANILTTVLGGMKDAVTNEVLIPGFYDDVLVLDEEERNLLSKTAQADGEIIAEADVKGVRTVKEIPAYLSPKVLPSLDINGIEAGYTGPGPKTVIPRKATAKFSTRIVNNQTSKKMREIMEDYVKSRVPADVDYTLEVLSQDNAFYSDFRNPWVQQVEQLFKNHFGGDVLYNRSGGSIPVAEMLQRLFNKPVVITGFTLPGENMHSPNENISALLFTEGIQVLKKVFTKPYKVYNEM